MRVEKGEFMSVIADVVKLKTGYANICTFIGL